jgi:tRNA dimethylallyltransferase
MEANSLKSLPLVVIVGPTASGKTSAAIKLAKEANGEIICADSRTIYKGMDIGTAKPTLEEQAGVPHWGLDLVKPGDYFTAADFKQYAEAKITDIRARGRIPFLVGGTGLYIDAVLFDYQFGPAADSERRAYLEMMSLGALRSYCLKNNIKLPENDMNKRYVIRAIEQQGISAERREQPIANSIIVGITTEREILRERITQRAEQIFDSDVVEEATLLGEKYGWESEAMTGNIYPLIHSYLEGRTTFLEMKDKFTTLDWRLAKRQLTWLRRNKFIKWMPLSEVYGYVSGLLAKQ